MTFYEQEFLRIKEEHFSKDYLYPRIIRAKLFIDNFYDNPIDLDAVAEEAHFSKFHFIRLFKTTYGKTPHQYLISVRIEKAKLFLRTSAPVSCICFWVGFYSPSSFTGLFKRMTGFTPSAFQNKERKPKSVAGKISIQYHPLYFSRKELNAKNRNFKEVTV
ncbi:MAG: AraC family transcriptional regulator [Chitinophagaceae bacterium]